MAESKITSEEYRSASPPARAIVRGSEPFGKILEGLARQTTYCPQHCILDRSFETINRTLMYYNTEHIQRYGVEYVYLSKIEWEGMYGYPRVGFSISCVLVWGLCLGIFVSNLRLNQDEKLRRRRLKKRSGVVKAVAVQKDRNVGRSNVIQGLGASNDDDPGKPRAQHV